MLPAVAEAVVLAAAFGVAVFLAVFLTADCTLVVLLLWLAVLVGAWLTAA